MQIKTQGNGIKFRYAKYQNNNDSNTKAYKKWYGRAVHHSTLTADNIADAMMQHNSPYGADVIKGVLERFWIYAFEMLFTNHWVKLPGLGTLRVSLNSEGSATEEDFTPLNITGFKIGLLPDQSSEQLLSSKDLRARVAFYNAETDDSEDSGSSGGNDPVEELPG